MADPRRRIALAALMALALAACQQSEPILPGDREAIRPPPEELPGTPPALRLPAPRANADWGQLNAGPTHAAPAAALDLPLTTAWSVELGEGSARRRRLHVAPVVADGRVFAMDAGATLSAVSTAGQVLWRAPLAPPEERSTQGFGGGLAAADGALVAATGLGEVLRLDPASGEILWRTAVDGPVRGAPVIAGGRAFVVARGDLAYAVDLATGAVLWRVQALGDGPGVLGGAGPAVRGPLVVLPFASGEVRGVLAENGLTVWTAAVRGGRRGLVRSGITAVAGDPVIDGQTVYAGNQAGRLVALDRRSGQPVWTQTEGTLSPALPAGNSVFVVSDSAALLRLSAEDGRRLWEQSLPEWVDPEKRRRAVAHYGPLLAGGRLIVVSGDGLLRSFAPGTGAPLGQAALPGPAAAQPAIAARTLYLVTSDGRLHALR